MLNVETKKANYVFILNKDRSPLGLIHPGYARKLLKDGFAAILRRYPFVVILKNQVDFTPDSYQVKIDPGSKTTGFAILRGNQVLFCMELEHRGDLISKKLRDRKSQRRNRRNRKTRYRRCKFNNRRNRKGETHSSSRKLGKLQPSIMHRSLTIRTWVERLSKWCPISNAVVELVKFDCQKMENPDINGVQYQQGTLEGYEVREYLLERDKRKCVYCGIENVPLQIDHIYPKSRGGSDRVSNLTLACESCNLKKSNSDLVEFLLSDKFKLDRVEAIARAKEIEKHVKTPLKDAAAVNSSRKKTVELVSEILLTNTSSGAQTKKNRLDQDLPKYHWVDAACVGEIPKLLFQVNQPLLVKCQGHGDRQLMLPNKHGFPRGWCDRRKIFYGFRTGDIVYANVPYLEITLRAKTTKTTNKKSYKITWKQTTKYSNKCGIYVGRVACRATGSFNIKTEKETVEGIAYRFCKKLHSSDGYDYAFKVK